MSINPGSSDGALVIKDGAMIGIINSKLVGKGVEGIGFAIPAYYIENTLKIKFEE